MSMPDISLLDYKLLKCINKHKHVSVEEIKNKFEKKMPVVDYRLVVLEKELKYIDSEKNTTISITGRPSSKPTGFYKLNDAGKTALADYAAYRKDYKKNLWLKNAWIPILVSVITNVVIQLISPLILYLLSRLPRIGI